MGRKDCEKEKKENILKFLKENGDSTVWRMVTTIKANHFRIIFLLNKLLKEGKIEMRKETRAIYYFLPSNNKINSECEVGDLPQHHNKFQNDN